MNKKKKLLNEWQLINLLDRQGINGSKAGCVKIWKGVTYEHALVMFQIAYKLVNDGYTVFTETPFADGSGRPDIVAIINGHGFIIEVLHSETDEMFERKKYTYPLEYTLLKVHTEDFDIDKFEI